MNSVFEFALKPYADGEDPRSPTLPELIFLNESGEPTLCFEEGVELTEDDPIKDTYTIFKSLYTSEEHRVEKKLFPMYYLMFKRKLVKLQSPSMYEYSMIDIRTNLIDFINEHHNEFGYDKPVREQYFNDTYSDQNIDVFEETYQKKVADFVASTKKALRPKEDLEILSDNLRQTSPETRKVFITYEYTSEPKFDVMEFFNHALVSNTVPFINCYPFYKVYNGSNILEGWGEALPGVLGGYIKIGEDASKQTSYSLFEMNETYIRIESYDRDQVEESGKQALAQLLQIFPQGTIQMTMLEQSPKIIKEELYVECYFPDVDLNMVLFKQFIYTHPTFRHFYFIDESVYITRKKSYLLFHYYSDPLDQSLPPISIAISNQFMDRPQENLSAGRCHTRVYVRRCTRNNLDTILKDIRRCMLAYLEKKDALQASLLSLFTKESVTEAYNKECKAVVSEEKEVDEFTNIWGPLKRSIQNRATVIPDASNHYLINPNDTVDPSVYDRQDETKPQAIYYPSKEDAEKMPQRFYTCDDKKTPYIGLTEYDQDRYDIPYVPVCFTIDQLEKENSALVSYLSNKKVESSGSGYIIRTGKQLRLFQVGGMMTDVDRWISFVTPSKKLFRHGLVSYGGKGVPEFTVPKKYRSSSVLYLLEYYVRGVVPQKVNIEKLRDQLVKRLQNQAIYYSETFRYTVSELIDILKQNQFIDPRLFYHLLKNEYQTELFLFTKDEQKAQSPFYPTCPYFHHHYVDVQPSYQHFLMIAINKGAEFDPDDVPICEIVEDQEKSIDKRPAKEERRFLANHVYNKLFQQTIEELYNRKLLYHPFREHPVYQTLDTFGKVAWLHFQHRDKLISMHLHIPIHSLELPVLTEKTYTSDPQATVEFLMGNKAQVAERKDGKGNVLGIYVKKDEYKYYIPLEQSKTEYSFVAYQFYEKLSRVVMEYTYYLFSVFLKEKNAFPSDDMIEYYKEFSEKYFDIDPTVKYNNLDRKWTFENNTMVRHVIGLTPAYQIVVPNEISKTKLMYLLRQKFNTNPELLFVYHEFNYIPNYYKTTADFTIQPRSIIFENSKNIEQYRQHYTTSLSSGKFTVQPDSKEPYLLYKSIPELGHSVFLVQPAISLDHAIYICDEWNKKGVNQGHKNYVLDHPCTQMVWKSDYEYLLYPEQGGENHIVMTIVKDRGQVVYQSLLPYKVI